MALLDDLVDPKFIGQEGMRQRAATEIKWLRALMVEAGQYVAVCPVPSGLVTEVRAELSDTRHRIASAAAQICNDGQSSNG